MSSFIRLVCHTSELQPYTTHRLFQSLKSDVSQESLTLVAVWIMGEFGDTILQAAPTNNEVEEVSDIMVLQGVAPKG
jgi:AP-1 complex subunit gamma-1